MESWDRIASGWDGVFRARREGKRFSVMVLLVY